MDFISGLGAKGWALLALVLVVAAVFGRYEYNMRQLRQADETIVKQTITIVDQADTIKTGEVVAEVKDEVRSQVNEAVTKVNETHKAVVAKLEQREQVINDKQYGASTEAVLGIDKATELSTARIDAMWEFYCADKPAAEGCVVNPPGAPHV